MKRTKKAGRSRDPVLSALGRKRHLSTSEKPGRRRGESAAATPSAPKSAASQSRRGLRGLLQLLGPGLITGASDDDPSGIGTYAQVGSQLGFGLVWLSLFTFPLMAAVQESCARIALQTKVGLGLALRRKFPAWIVAIAIAMLLIANTINIGADLGAVAAGGSLLAAGKISPLWLVAPAAILILSLQLAFSYSVIFNTFKWLTLVLFSYAITAFIVHPSVLAVLRALVLPHFEWNTKYITAFVAILGTTISPYLFFWQASAEVDEMEAAGRKTEASRRGVKVTELKAARLDIFTGMLFANAVMFFIMITAATVLHAHGHDDIQTAEQAAASLAPLAGPLASLLFALGMIGTGLLAIPILSGSASYALKEFFRLPGSLADKPKNAPTFYAVIVIATLLGVGMNFLHINPIQALFLTAVINGLAAPPLLILITLLASDKQQMKSKVSSRLSKTLMWIVSAVMTVAALALLWTTFMGKK